MLLQNMLCPNHVFMAAHFSALKLQSSYVLARVCSGRPVACGQWLVGACPYSDSLVNITRLTTSHDR